MDSNILEKDQELKELILKDLMFQEYEEIDFSQSIDDAKHIWIHLF